MAQGTKQLNSEAEGSKCQAALFGFSFAVFQLEVANLNLSMDEVNTWQRKTSSLRAPVFVCDIGLVFLKTCHLSLLQTEIYQQT